MLAQIASNEDLKVVEVYKRCFNRDKNVRFSKILKFK